MSASGVPRYCDRQPNTQKEPGSPSLRRPSTALNAYLFNTLADIFELVRQIDHPNLKMIFDTHHAHIEEKNTLEVIEKYAPHFGHVHISENDRGIPGSGQVRWNEVFSTLHRMGYDGWLTIEAFSRNNPEFASGINVWRNYADSLESVYREGYRFIRSQWDQVAS